MANAIDEAHRQAGEDVRDQILARVLPEKKNGCR
jgi:hypothetical protein